MKALFTILFLFSVSAQAGDIWDNCSNAERQLTRENEVYYYEGEEITVQVLERKVLEDVRKKCILKKSKEEVVSYRNTVSAEKVQFSLGSTVKSLWLMCELGGSGIPEGDNCQEN